MPQHAAQITAIVVTYNRLAQLRLTVARLLAEPLDRLLIVDNGSDDGSRAWLASQTDPRLCVLMPEQNGGGAAGFEIGLRHAMAAFAPDWCLLMDDDARPEAGVVAQFRAADWQGAAAVAGAVYFPQGGICEMNRPWINPFSGAGVFLATLRKGRAAFHLPDDAFTGKAVVAIDGASFVGLFLSREAVARVGYPDGRLFIYGDDVHYTLSLSKAGGRICFAPQLRFEHDCATQDEDGIFRPLWKTYYRYRNLGFVYRLAAGPLLFWPIIALMRLKWYLHGFRLRGAERQVHRAMCRLAFADCLANRRDRPHPEIRARAQGCSPP